MRESAVSPKVRSTHFLGGYHRVINERGAFDFLQAARKAGLTRVVHFGFGPGGDNGVEAANWASFVALAGEHGVEVSQ
jgi:hypothetical protein